MTSFFFYDTSTTVSHTDLLIVSRVDALPLCLVGMPNGAYELQTRYLDRQPHPNVGRGTFDWQPDGSIIRLDKAGDEQRYFVAEGRLIQLYQDGSRPTGPLAPHYELTQVR